MFESAQSKKYHDNKFDNDDDSDIGNNDGPNNKGKYYEKKKVPR